MEIRKTYYSHKYPSDSLYFKVRMVTKLPKTMRPFKEANSLPEHKLDLNVHYTIQINIKNEKNRRQLLHKLFLSILKQLFKVKKHHNVVINL